MNHAPSLGIAVGMPTVKHGSAMQLTITELVLGRNTMERSPK